MKRMAFGLSVLLALTLALAGCQSIAEKATEKAVEGATGVDIEQDGDEVTITGEDGTEVTSSSDGELPDGFPDDVPVPDGKITGSMKSGDGFTVSITSSDEFLDAYEWYLDELKAEKWTATSEMKAEDGGAISAEKDDRTLVVTFGEDSDEGSIVTITTGPKP